MYYKKKINTYTENRKKSFLLGLPAHKYNEPNCFIF